MPPQRKKPFSAKQKKQQLREKRDQKRDRPEGSWGGHHAPRRGRGRAGTAARAPILSSDSREHTMSSGDESPSEDDLFEVKKVNQQKDNKTDKGYDPNRYRLHFQKETKAEIEHRKELARQPLETLPESALELDLDDIYQPGSVLDMPKRPSWNYNMSKAQLDTREENYFREYLESIVEKYDKADLSYFELNLETWRQLWRVLEMADIVLLITDIRHPALHFSPALYEYVTEVLHKPLIMVLNKIDLAPPALVIAWKTYFQQRFPELHIITFTAFPKDRHEQQLMADDPGKMLHKKRKRGHYQAVGDAELLQACEKIVQGKVDLRSWKQKIEGALGSENIPATEIHLEERDSSYVPHEQYRDGVLTIGCCGYPNVGKSSLLNGLVGKKVVSVSRTPGHTKHFQTIYLTPNVKLCDSPGLVFPSLIPKAMQVLAGIYPIAQLREPYTAVGFLAERIPVHTILRLKHPEEEDSSQTGRLPWTAFYICEAWAEKRGFFTARAARNDAYRGANSILRLANDGRLILNMRPPGYTAKKLYWEENPDTQELAKTCHLHRHGNRDDDSDSGEEGDLSLSDADDEEEETEDPEADQDEASVSVSNPFATLGDADD